MQTQEEPRRSHVIPIRRTARKESFAAKKKTRGLDLTVYLDGEVTVTDAETEDSQSWQPVEGD